MTIAEQIRKFIGSGKKGNFAKEAGISPVSLSRYLSGSQPNRVALQKLARVLGVTIDSLLGLEVHENPGPYGGLDPKDQNIVDELLNLLEEADDDIRRHLSNQIVLLRRAAKTPKRRVSGKN